jgi:4-amino-4-deoxy-L-arabinose transferase-like glycosyltransferase
MMISSALLQRASRALFILAFILLIFHLVVYVVYAANLIGFPFDYDQGEGFELVDTVMFSRGEWPYQDTEAFPFYSSNYPPLYHVIAAPFVWLFGPAYWYGRLLSFLSTLVTAGAIAYAVHRETRHRPIAALAGLAFLASNTIYHIGPLFRQHISMVMFETVAVVLLAGVNEVQDKGRRRWLLVAGAALILAGGYTKQLAVVTALAAGIFMFIRQPRRAILWGLASAVVGVVIFGWMTWATDGEWWRQAILANVNEIKILQSLALFQQWFGLHGFLVIPAVLVVLYEIYFTRISLYSIWFVLAVGINGAASGTWGGGDSYFATAIAATCILSGIFAGRTLRGGWQLRANYLSRLLIEPFRQYAPMLAAAGLVVIPLLYLGYGRAVLKMPTNLPVFQQITQVFGIYANAQNGFYDSARTQDGQYAAGYAAIGHLTTAEDIAAGYRIVEMIQADERPAITEDAAFNIVAGREVITNPTQLLNLDKRGIFRGDELIEMIEAQAFGLIVLRAQFYPERVLITMGQHYERIEIISMNGFEYLILRPS